MSNYIATLFVLYKEEELDIIERRVVDIQGLDVAVFNCKFYPVKLDFKHGRGMCIDLHEQVKF